MKLIVLLNDIQSIDLGDPYVLGAVRYDSIIAKTLDISGTLYEIVEVEE